MQIDNEAEQLSIYDLDLWCGRMCPEPSPAEHQKERISGSSSRRSYELDVYKRQGILRGDDGRMYFQMLSHDLKALELQRLKAKAAKIPPKIRVFSFIMLMCFMMTYIVIIVYQIVTSLGSLF